MMEVREHREELAYRVRFLRLAIVVGLVGVCLGYWFLQILHGPTYFELSEHNRLRQVPVKATRGLIFDRTGTLLVENAPSYDLYIDRESSRDLAASLAFAARVLEVSEGRLAEVLEGHRRVPLFRPVLLGENLTLSQVARFEASALEHPEFSVEVEWVRLYRYGGQMAHVVGYLGQIDRGELARRGPPYTQGDLVGKKGVEQAFDGHLRGRDGQRIVVVDNRGRVVEEYRSEGAEPGGHLSLTLDLALQQEAERLLEDRVGSIVALDPKSGEVLALHSSPAFEPNRFARRLRLEEWESILSDPQRPLQNRVIQNTYPPGSIFKVPMAVAALKEGVVDPSHRVWCGGSTRIHNRRFRCWWRQGHGSVDLQEALKRSCDIYFYEIGQRLGIERIASWARRFGLGQVTGIDIWGERPGLVPDPEWSLRVRRHAWYPGETISVAIGQGPFLVTPLQVAVLMATVATGGDRVEPHLVARDGRPVLRGSADLDPRIRDRVVRALWAAVNEPGGTGRAAHVPGLDIVGKTGTVQVVGRDTWLEEGEELPPEHRYHAWFASYAPREDPQLVVVVFVEHGGQGSQAAAPLAKTLYERYFGILPPPGRSS